MTEQEELYRRASETETIRRTAIHVQPAQMACRDCGHVWIPRGREVRRCPRCQKTKNITLAE